MGGYRGGAFDTWIPDSYTYADFEADRKKAAPLILAVQAASEGVKYGDEIATLLFLDEPMTYAFGRMTAYAERNNMEDLYH